MTNENMILILEQIMTHYDGTCKEALEMAISAVKWIPVIERLPEDKQKVLCCVTNEKHSVVITYFEDASYWHDGKISAWMPCPEPYGGDV